MAFLKRKRKSLSPSNSIVKVDDIHVVTCQIISSHNDGRGGGPYCVTMCFLAKYIEHEYFELFSGKELESEIQPKDGVISKSFDTPYVKKVEPLRKYLRNQNKTTIDMHSLFDFITNLNVMRQLGAFED